jgi:hypothetical protein
MRDKQPASAAWTLASASKQQRAHASHGLVAAMLVVVER